MPQTPIAIENYRGWAWLLQLREEVELARKALRQDKSCIVTKGWELLGRYCDKVSFA